MFNVKCGQCGTPIMGEPDYYKVKEVKGDFAPGHGYYPKAFRQADGDIPFCGPKCSNDYHMENKDD